MKKKPKESTLQFVEVVRPSSVNQIQSKLYMELPGGVVIEMVPPPPPTYIAAISYELSGGNRC